MTIYKSLEEAVAISCENLQALGSEYLHINQAFMRVTAEDIISLIDVPGFDRSAMDGYVICQSDLEKLKSGQPLPLRVTATIKASSSEDKQVRSGETLRIMTGALVPEGSAAVIKQEEVQTNGDFIVACKDLKPGENIQRAGHKLRAGDRAAAKGQVLKAELIERIVACGIEKILVHKIPRIYIIDTGSELLLPGSPIKTGHIYSSNRSLLSAKAMGVGAIPLVAEASVEDKLEAIIDEIEKAVLVSDMVIISGGTGNGLYDLVYDAFQHLDAQPLFRGIDTIPGKGTSAVRYKGKILYNLSGNPYAAGILFEVLIKPALLKLKGDLFSSRDWFDIKLGSTIKDIKLGRNLCRGAMIIEKGCIYAHPISRQNNDISDILLILDLQSGQGVIGDSVKAKLYDY